MTTLTFQFFEKKYSAVEFVNFFLLLGLLVLLLVVRVDYHWLVLSTTYASLIVKWIRWKPSTKRCIILQMTQKQRIA